MPTIEFPLSRDASDIIGSFVVISVDPVASVAALEDEQATAAAARISTGRYLAFVKGYLDFQWTEDGPKLTLRFSLGGRGLPSPPHSWAAVPVSPAQARGECTRPPVDPDVPLPWDDCHLYTLQFTGGNVSRIYDAERRGPRLSDDGQMYVLTAQYEDQRAFGLAERARREEEEDAVDTRPPTPDQGTPDDPPPVLAESQQADNSPVTEDDHGTDEQALMAELFQQDDIPRMTPHFEVWLNLEDSSEELSDPAHIQHELEQLERIEWEWAQRTVADAMSKGPETNAWLAGLAEAEVPPHVEDAHVEFDDALVRPEDAIEHRMEQGTLLPIAIHGGSVTGPLETHPTGETTTSKNSVTVGGEGQNPSESQKNRVSPSGLGELSVFRVILRGILSIVSRLKSLMWGIIWRKPNPAP